MDHVGSSAKKGITRRQFLQTGAVLGGVAALGGDLAFAQTKTRLSIATGGTGGVYYPLGGAIANLISKYLPGVEATAEVTAAAVDNLKLVGAGKADFGYAYPDLAYDALMGQGLFKAKLPVMLLINLYISYLHLITLASSGIKSVADLKGKRVSTGAPGSGTEVVALRVIEAVGLNPDKDLRRDRLSVNESAGALKDGKMDAFWWVGGVPTAAVLDLAATPGVSIALVPNGPALPKIFEKHGKIYVPAKIPAGTYQNVTTDTEVVGIPNIIVCQQKADPQLIHDVLRVMFEHRDELVAVRKEAQEYSPGGQIQGSQVPYHPGAVKFFAEKGAKL